VLRLSEDPAYLAVLVSDYYPDDIINTTEIVYLARSGKACCSYMEHDSESLRKGLRSLGESNYVTVVYQVKGLAWQ
jgi:hypothetical protein